MLYLQNLWIEDIDRVLSVIPELKRLERNSVLITGAGGLICSAIVDILFRYNDTHDSKIGIIAAGRNYRNMAARFGTMVNRPDFRFLEYDAAQDSVSLDSADYIIHGASNASPKMYMQEPVETMVGNFGGMNSLLRFAKNVGAKRILYISSSEVYGQKDQALPYKEDEYGYIDLLSSRNSYAIAKRATETLCISYGDEYGLDTVIVRPGHVYGPTASRRDNRVSSAWPYMVAKKENIVMKSSGSQIRSYCYCLDCASAILKVLLCGEKCSAYNISNQESIITIKELAEIHTDYTGVELVMEVPSEAEKKAFNPMDNSSLIADRLWELGWKGCFSAKEGLEHTVDLIMGQE